VIDPENIPPPEPVSLHDLDGSMADFDGAMLEGLKKIASPGENDIGSKLLANQATEPDWHKERRRLVKSQPGFWRTLPRIQLGFDVFEACRNLEYTQLVLTNGPKVPTWAWGEKVDWCNINVPETPVIVGRDKGLVYGRVLADDWPEYIVRWLTWRPRGLVIMIAQRWNIDFKHPNVVRYDGKNYDEMVNRLGEARRRPSGP
jgi:5'-nucleotidase